MASYYVYSGAAGAGTGADWANAYTTLTDAVSGKAAGDVFYIAHDHAETTAGELIIISPGHVWTPCRFLCVDRAGSVPPVSADLRTTATITSTVGNNCGVDGSGYWYGLTFHCNVVGTANVPLIVSENHAGQFKNCLFKITGPSGAIKPGATSGANHVLWDNCQVQFSNVGHFIEGQTNWRWINTPSAVQGTSPTALINMAHAGRSTVVLEGVDLSALGSGQTIVAASTNHTQVTLKDCKLGASVTLAGTPTTPSTMTDFVRCDSGATNYRTERYHFSGTLTTETAIVRSGGASDGTTPISWKIITTADSEWHMPFETFPISIWNETTGSPITITVEGIWDSGTVPNNDDIWMDVEYLGDASFPLGSVSSGTKSDILATGSALASSSEIWSGSTTAFKMQRTITPQMKGPITAYVRAAKVSSTFYLDPKITLS